MRKSQFIIHRVALFVAAVVASAWACGPPTRSKWSTSPISLMQRSAMRSSFDIAATKGLDHPVPAVVVIHGGGWSGGKRQDMTPIAKQITAHGYVAPTISYRLAPKHRFPAQIEDVKAAVRYLRAHAKELNIDPKRIGAMGVSAGAHLSLMLGTMDSEDGLEGDGGNPDQPSKVQAVVSYVGPINLVIDEYTPTQTGIITAFLGGPPKEKVEECRRAFAHHLHQQGRCPDALLLRHR